MKYYVKETSVLLVSLLFMASCSKDDNAAAMGKESYTTDFKITDAPIDNANAKAVFVTIADVKVNGNSLEGFEKSTIELSALANGSTEQLGSLQLTEGTYSDIELVLDYASDEAGQSPGCYVEMADGSKDKLVASANSIHLNDGFEVLASAANQIILDFDLRKTIREEQGALTSNFEFVSMSELDAGIRSVNESSTGTVSGSVNDSQQTSDKIVVYAYKKGTYNADTETHGSGESGVLFAHAVTSSSVDGITHSYSLNFLESGDYELVFASYAKDGDAYSFNTMLKAESTTGLDLGSLSVTNALELDANVTITGTK